MFKYRIHNMIIITCTCTCASIPLIYFELLIKLHIKFKTRFGGTYHMRYYFNKYIINRYDIKLDSPRGFKDMCY